MDKLSLKRWSVLGIAGVALLALGVLLSLGISAKVGAHGGDTTLGHACAESTALFLNLVITPGPVPAGDFDCTTLGPGWFNYDTGDISGVEVAAGSGLTGGAGSGVATLGTDSAVLQQRVAGTCPVGQAIRVIAGTGAVTCQVAGGIGGAGTANMIAKFTGASTTGDSVIAESAGNVGIGTASPSADLHIQGNLSVALSGNATVATGSAVVNGVGTLFTTELNVADAILIGSETFTVASIESDTQLMLDVVHTAGALSVPAFTDSDLLRVQNGAGVDKLTVDKSGKVATACPAGFTSIAAAGNQLGCMQTDLANGGVADNWNNAADHCFDSFGGLLPSTAEWFIAVVNFTLSDETDFWEWNADSGEMSDVFGHAVSGNGGIGVFSWASGSALFPFRCWIPR